MKIVQHIIYCLAKIVKTPVIKERNWINQRKTYVKRIFTNQKLYFAAKVYAYILISFTFCIRDQV